MVLVPEAVDEVVRTGMQSLRSRFLRIWPRLTGSKGKVHTTEESLLKIDVREAIFYLSDRCTVQC